MLQNLWKAKDCNGNPHRSFPISAFLEQMNGTLLESKCDGKHCDNKIMQNVYEINSCESEIDEHTKYSQTAVIGGECIIGPSYSLKHRCHKGKHRKVTTIYYSDKECSKKVKSEVSKCNPSELFTDSDQCSIEESEQIGIITDNCCIHSSI